jgi:hypothetical protein
MPPDDKRKSEPVERSEQGSDQPQGSTEENPDSELEKQKKERDYVAKTSRRGYV